MCLYPKLIRNPKYKSNKKNGGEIPHCHDKRVLEVPIGCGKCIECCRQKANGWKIRLLEEMNDNPNAKFITLSFSDEALDRIGKKFKLSGYELDNEIARYAMREFCESVRLKYGKSPRHWAITEIGGNSTERLHIHGIFWTENKNWSKEQRTELKQKLSEWKNGNVWIDSIRETTIGYIVKYMHKPDKKHKEYTPRIMASKGLGKGYINRHNSKLNRFKGVDTDERYIYPNGFKGGIPKYYRNLLYTDAQREELWINKLEKGERYVLGQKIDIKGASGTEAYWRALKEAQRKNKRLGYGNDEINWERKRYENDLRRLGRKK